MTEQSDFFEYKIPTHIEFTLYTKDRLENLVIRNIKKYCKNYLDEEKTLLLRASSFVDAMMRSKIIREEYEKKIDLHSPDFRVNSVTFIKSLIFSFVNLEWITIHISDLPSLHQEDEKGKHFVKFDFEIKQGIVDLPSIFTKDELNRFNKELIKDERICNKYINRSPYIYITLLDLFYFVDVLEGSECILLGALLDQFDAKFEANNPILLLKTDYSIL